MILGITGKIASGKTEVMKVFEKSGFDCIYADKIVHELYKSGGEGAKKIENVFGNEFINKDKSVNRKKLRNLVFNNPKKLEILNKTIHPLVFKKIRILLNEMEGENIAIESVYLDFNSFDGLIDKIIWIERPVEEILKVLINEREFSEDLAKKAAKFITKPNKVDFIVKNEGNLSDLKVSVMDIVKFL